LKFQAVAEKTAKNPEGNFYGAHCSTLSGILAFVICFLFMCMCMFRFVYLYYVSV